MSSTSRTLRLAITSLATGLVIVTLTGCGLINFDSTGSHHAGRSVEGATMQTLFRQGADEDPTEPAVDVELHAVADLGQLPPDLSSDIRNEISNLVDEAAGRSVIVVGTYGDCEQQSRVVYGQEPGTVEFVVEYLNGDVDCAWTPQAIDAWIVPIEAFDAD